MSRWLQPLPRGGPKSWREKIKEREEMRVAEQGEIKMVINNGDSEQIVTMVDEKDKSVDIEAHETPLWKLGFNEGYICGQQEMISRLLEVFFKGDEAKENHLKYIEAELVKVGRKEFVNINWLGQMKEIK